LALVIVNCGFSFAYGSIKRPPGLNAAGHWLCGRPPVQGGIVPWRLPACSAPTGV
jgi:hypothetical protein